MTENNGFFSNVLDNSILFKIASKILPDKGNLVYEYNPFRNYRLTEDRFEYDGAYLTFDNLIKKLKELHNIDLNTVLLVYRKEVTDKGNVTYININPIDGETGNPKDITKNKVLDVKEWNTLYIDNEGKTLLIPEDYLEPILREAGLLVDFITDELSFDINHPIDILPLYSYDDSVNLILNDGKNKPRLINSRFSAIGRNKYQVVDRKGNYDTNIYDLGETFDTDTSLYKLITKIPRLLFLGTTSGGALSVGNYHFYFRYLDSDGNASDFVAESGLVSVFIGLGTSSVRSGFREEDSHKIVRFILSNIDQSYHKVEVFFTRATSDIMLGSVTSAFKIKQSFEILLSGVCEINITGFEDVNEVSVQDINPLYLLCDNVRTQATCLNMLFFGNILKPSLEYIDLLNTSLYFLPYLKEKEYDYKIDKNYNINSGKGYTDSQFIYNFTGYWDQELYRFGIVYILSDNTLSPVFNIRGAEDIEVYNDKLYTDFLNENDNEIPEIKVSEEGFILEKTSPKLFENGKGVVTFKLNISENDSKDYILGVDIRVNKRIIDYLQTKHKIKGFFFVRLKRIPTILCQALTIGVDKESHTPVLPVSTNADENKIIEALGLNSDDENKYYICRNIKSGEIVAGDTLIPRPEPWYKTFTSIMVGLTIGAAVGLTTGGAMLPAIMAGSITAAGSGGFLYGVTDAIIGTTYDYAWKVYQNNDEWEVYHTLLRIDPDEDSVCYISERFLTDSKQLEHNFNKRLYFLPKRYVSTHIAICPEYDTNYPYYNNIFNGDTLVIEESKRLPKNEYLSYDLYDERHFYNDEFTYNNSKPLYYLCPILGVEDNVKLVGIGDEMFSGRAGEPEEAFRYSYLGIKDKLTSSYNLVRGSFGPFLALTKYDKSNRLLNIRISGYNQSNLRDYFKIRFNDKSSFYAISERIDLTDLNYWFKKVGSENTSVIDETFGELLLRNELYRGDCYICQFTHRLNRNFQDPSAPTNDDIVDSKCWALNYEVSDGVLKTENFEKINLGDVNAIQMGMWVTSTYRSSRNLNIRNIDESLPDEVTLFGHPRSYYPYTPMFTEGTYKIPEALCFNGGFEKSVSERYNFEVPDVPAIRNNFATRVLYSDIQINDAYKNGFRTFKGDHFKDYPITYGSITKLIELNGYLICVFEHGIGRIAVNERALTGQGSGGNIYVNTPIVLPDNPDIISDTYGSLWKDSIIKTKEGNIYGIDTVAKKIWTINKSRGFQILSDFSVLEFLNNNISLTERELDPVIGLRNVKTHYNAFKGDVMFTFYDGTYGFEEKVWNLCYNELLEKFVTFYSWIPSYSENIYNTYFSFDRNVSKWIARLSNTKKGSDFAQGIVLDNNIIKPGVADIGILTVDEKLLPNKKVDPTYKFVIEHDILGNWKYFNIVQKDANHVLQLKVEEGETLETVYRKLCTEHFYRVKEDSSNLIAPYDENGNIDSNYNLNLPLYYDETKRRKWLEYNKQPNGGRPVILLNIKVEVTISKLGGDINIKECQEYVDSYNDNYSTYGAGEYDCIVSVIPEYNLLFLESDFWKHGLSGIIDLKDTIKPTHWYGKLHPFEFEFVVNDNPDKHKIFDTLEIISNNAEPESFHYEIVGDCYDFAKDKKNMYIRQEATKELYLYNGSNIVYNRDYLTLNSEPNKISGVEDNLYYSKSTIFPLYYNRLDTIDEIEDYYNLYKGDPNEKDFSALSGAEIVRYKKLDEYRIWNHSKATDVKEGGVLRGNMFYKEDTWKVQINPINYVQENELKSDWVNYNGNELVPAEYNIFPPPNDINNNDELYLPEGWKRSVVSWGVLNMLNKEVKVKDKFIKIRIRYSGEKLAIISAIKTLYSISYG